jgi:hypothetical protein
MDPVCRIVDIGCPRMLCPNMLVLTCLPLFKSVQKVTYDILGNVVTISINQALESIHPVDKDRVDHFD